MLFENHMNFTIYRYNYCNICSCSTLVPIRVAKRRISRQNTHIYIHWPTQSQVTPVYAVRSSALVANEAAWAWTFASTLSDQLSWMMSECCKKGKTRNMAMLGSFETLLKLTQLTAQKVCGT